MSNTSTGQVPIQTNFNKSLKPIALEEFFDYYFYRRLAHLIIPLFVKMRLSPNQVTTLSLITGLLAAWMVYSQNFIAGAVLIIAAVVFDCCDGQIARLTGKTSPFGRIMDGAFDMIWITALWLAIYFSGFFHEHHQTHLNHLLWLMITAAFSTFVHCWRFDAVKLRYMELASPDSTEYVKDIDVKESTRLMKEHFKNLRLIMASLCFLNIMQNTLSGRNFSEKRGSQNLSPETRLLIKNKLEPLIKRWPWLGEGHHNTLIILGLFALPFTPIVIFIGFWTILLPMNLWYIYCELKWQFAIKEVNQLIIKKS